MLPRQARMRRSEDFRRTVRRGVRAGRRTVVVHALRVPGTRPAGRDRDPGSPRPDAAPGDAQGTASALVGFVVPRTVGGAVRRNRVRRRLRHLARSHLRRTPGQTLVVVRALPPAATAGPELDIDLAAAWTAVLRTLDRR